MTKDELKALRQQSTERRKNSLAFNNTKGTKVGFIGIHYRQNDISNYLANANSQLVAEALAMAGHLKMWIEQDGVVKFQTITDGVITPDRKMPPSKVAEQIVEEYCDAENCNPDGSDRG